MQQVIHSRRDITHAPGSLQAKPVIVLPIAYKFYMKKIRTREGEKNKDNSSIRNCSKLLENFKTLVQITKR